MVHIENVQYKVAFFEGNRVINSNSVEKHKESLLGFGRNLIPLIYLKGDDEALKGKKIVDAVEGTEILEADRTQYVVVVDGQHRFLAAKELADENKFDLANLVWNEVKIPEGKTVEDVIVEINAVGQKWRGADYISGYALRYPENEVVQFALMLVKEGLSAKTANKYIFFEYFDWRKKSNEEALKAANLDRANEIWNVVKTFSGNVKGSSVIIDYIIKEGGNKHWKAELDKVSQLNDEDRETLKKTKKTKVREAFEELMNK